MIVTGIATADYTGITYNSVALTKAVTVTDSSAGRRVQIWYLINPATGTNTIAVTGNSDRCQSASYTGVKQTGFPDASASIADSSRVGAGDITVALTVVASGCWVVSTSYDTTLNPTAGVIATTRRGGETTYGSGRLLDSNGTVSTGSINVGFTYAGSNTATIPTLSFAPAAAAASSYRGRALLGVGL